jgi:predicted aspartyl protease
MTIVRTAYERLAKKLSPIQEHLQTIASQVLFRTPPRISSSFPTISVTITDDNLQSYDIRALLDSGATSTYISPSFVSDHNIPTRKLKNPMYAYNADDTLNATQITHEAQITIQVQGHRSTEWYFVTDIGTKDMIIGMTWLKSHNPLINWRTGALEFT